MIRFVKVASSTNDANIEYYVNPDMIKGISTTATTSQVFLAAVDGTANNEVGDHILITHTSGKGPSICASILRYGMGNKSNGGVAVTVDANFHNSDISALLFTAA